MIKLSQHTSPALLANLGCENLAIQTVDSCPHKLVAYLDFEEIFPIHSISDDSIWSKLQPMPADGVLSFSGWVGFFGYELLAFQFGIHTKAKRDLPVPAGWFGRPATIVNFNQEETVIESKDPNREQEIEKRLQNPLSHDSPTLTHQKHSCCLLYTSPRPRDGLITRKTSSA